MRKQSTEAEVFEPDVLGTLRDLEKAVKIQSISLGAEDRLSTGLLCADLMLGGGLCPAMYTFAGPEQSSKTTFALTAMAAAVSQSVPFNVLWDAENSSGSSMDYVENVFKNAGLKVDIETIFGIKEKGQYVTKPLVYYRDEAEMDTFYNWLSGLLRRLPDKRFENKQWWYVYEASQENKSKFKGMMDRKLSSENNAIYVPAKDGAPQAFVLCDSYPALLPDALDDDDPKAGMALAAREFSKNVPRVAGKLRAKRVVLVGLNQIREKIGFVMGDPRYEPGGNTLRFFSSVRVWNTPRALSGVPFNPKGKGQYEKEPSVTFEGGEDTYRYIHSKAIKNKLSVPNRETWFRIWVEDGSGVARGFCPVWDTFYAMHLTGQVSGKRTAMTLNVHGMGEAKRTLKWEEFKLLVLGTREEIIEVCQKIGYKPFNLRKGLFALMKKGVMEDLYTANLRKSNTKKGEDEEEEDDD